MNGILVVLGLLFLIVGIYMSSYILNKNTAAPAGAPVISKCSTCGTSGSCAISSSEGPTDSEQCELH